MKKHTKRIVTLGRYILGSLLIFAGGTLLWMTTPAIFQGNSLVMTLANIGISTGGILIALTGILVILKENILELIGELFTALTRIS